MIRPVVPLALIADGVKRYERRPVPFFHEGGPGSSSVWLHMGSCATSG